MHINIVLIILLLHVKVISGKCIHASIIAPGSPHNAIILIQLHAAVPYIINIITGYGDNHIFHQKECKQYPLITSPLLVLLAT